MNDKVYKISRDFQVHKTLYSILHDIGYTFLPVGKDWEDSLSYDNKYFIRIVKTSDLRKEYPNQP